MSPCPVVVQPTAVMASPCGALSAVVADEPPFARGSTESHPASDASAIGSVAAMVDGCGESGRLTPGAGGALVACDGPGCEGDSGVGASSESWLSVVAGAASLPVGVAWEASDECVRASAVLSAVPGECTGGCNVSGVARQPATPIVAMTAEPNRASDGQWRALNVFMSATNSANWWDSLVRKRM